MKMFRIGQPYCATLGFDLGETHATRVVIAQRYIADHVTCGQLGNADPLQHAQRFIVHADCAGIRQDAVGQFKDDAVDTVHPHICVRP
jgi:hypothetical protein